MSNPGQNDPDAVDRDVRTLLELAGPRAAPPTDTEDRIRHAYMAAFDELPAPRSTAPARYWLAAAATALLFVAVTVVFLSSTPATPAAEILYASGTYTVRSGDSESRIDSASQLAPATTLLTTADSRLLLGLNNGATLRLDHLTSLTIDSAAVVELHHGRIYIDAQNSATIMVVTPHATVIDVGTQFEVAVIDQELTVALRDGEVDVNSGHEVVRALAQDGVGEVLTFAGGSLEARLPLPATDAHWQWTQSARPPFKLKGRSVAEYLEWAASETGRTLKFDSDIVRQQASMPAALSGEGAVEADPISVAQTLRTTRFELASEGTDEFVVRFRAL